MRSRGSDDGVLKIIVGAHLRVFLLDRKLILASTITSKARSNNRPRVSIRKLCGVHMDPDGSLGPFHSLVL